MFVICCTITGKSCSDNLYFNPIVQTIFWQMNFKISLSYGITNAFVLKFSGNLVLQMEYRVYKTCILTLGLVT